MFIREAIESVLASDYKNFELIISDDCSTDLSVSIAENYVQSDSRVQLYVNDVNIGDYPNRNKAASYARGKYLKFVDSDDYIYKDTISQMVDGMEKYPSAAFAVSSRNQDVERYFTSLEAYQCHFFERGLLDYGPTAAIIRSDCFRQINGFKQLQNVSDVDLWLRLAANYPMLELPKNLVYWRIHPSQQTKLAPEKYNEYFCQILTENLLSDACPLSKLDALNIINKYRKFNARSILRFLIKTGKIKKSFYLWNVNNHQIKELF